MVFQCFPKGSGFFKSLRCKSRRAQGIHQNIADILIIFNGPDFTQSKYRAGKITGCPFCFFACFFRLAGEIQLVLFGFYLFGSLSVIFLLHNTLRNALKITPYKSVFKPSDSIVPFTNFSKVCQIDVIHLLV